jgi:hypothetical protein
LFLKLFNFYRNFLNEKKKSLGQARVVFQKSFQNIEELATRTLKSFTKSESLNNIEKLSIDGDMSTSSSISSISSSGDETSNDVVSLKPANVIAENSRSFQQKFPQKYRAIPSFTEIWSRSLNYVSQSPNKILNVDQIFFQRITNSIPVKKLY